MERRSIIIYMQLIYRIGGAETWLYNLTNVLKDFFDVTVLYDSADEEQLARLPVKHEQYNNTNIYRCDILLNLFTGRPYRVRAKRYIQVIHSNYAEMPWYRFDPWNMTDTYIFVSEAARDGFNYSLGGADSVVLTNPLASVTIPPKAPRRDDTLKIMAATRFSEEKGGKRMILMMEQLKLSGIKCRLDVWTTWKKERFENQSGTIANLPIFFHEPKLNLQDEMVNSDYVCQLSDCEAFCYTIYESLSLHTPVLVTDWKGVRNAVRHSLNGYIYDMGLSNFDPKQLLQKPNQFGVLPNSNREWVRYLKEVELIHDNTKDFNYYFL